MSAALVANGTAARLAETAFAFASELGFSVEDSLRVDVLEGRAGSSLYRLSWRTPRAGSCIVKRCSREDGRRERALYESVLSGLSVPTLRYYGSRDESRESMWLVLEDAGDIEPSLESPVSRTLLTEWAARLHVEGARPRRRGLPNVGPRSFTRRLADAESRVRRRLANGRLDEHDRHVLARCAERCGELKALWPQIEETCSVFPRTIVHGDLVEKNLRLKASSAGPRLVPLDWEKAGWGVPAVDLVSVDPELYWERTSTWLGRTRAELDRLVIVGRIFTVLSRCWTETSIHEADRAEALLGRLLADAGWCG